MRSRPTDLYCYTTSDGTLTLTDVITDEQKINLNWQTMDMPEGWYADYLAVGAFAKSPQIQSLIDEEELAGIESGAFRGMDEDTDLHFYLENQEGVPELYGFVAKTSIDDANAVPFTFTGSAELDEQKVHITQLGMNDEDYLNAWIYPMAGYTGLSHMLELYGNAYEDETEMLEAIKAELLPVENRLRRMLGMAGTSELTVMQEQPAALAQPETPETPDGAPDAPEDGKEDGGAVTLPDTSGERPVVMPDEPETPTEPETPSGPDMTEPETPSEPEVTEPETPSGPEQGGEDNANEDPADSGAAGEGEETQE